MNFSIIADTINEKFPIHLHPAVQVTTRHGGQVTEFFVVDWVDGKAYYYESNPLAGDHYEITVELAYFPPLVREQQDEKWVKGAIQLAARLV